MQCPKCGNKIPPSERQIKANRENGKKGGRPRKNFEEDAIIRPLSEDTSIGLTPTTIMSPNT